MLCSLYLVSHMFDNESERDQRHVYEIDSTAHKAVANKAEEQKMSVK